MSTRRPARIASKPKVDPPPRNIKKSPYEGLSPEAKRIRMEKNQKQSEKEKRNLALKAVQGHFGSNVTRILQSTLSFESDPHLFAPMEYSDGRLGFFASPDNPRMWSNVDMTFPVVVDLFTGTKRILRDPEGNRGCSIKNSKTNDGENFFKISSGCMRSRQIRFIQIDHDKLDYSNNLILTKLKGACCLLLLTCWTIESYYCWRGNRLYLTGQRNSVRRVFAFDSNTKAYQYVNVELKKLNLYGLSANEDNFLTLNSHSFDGKGFAGTYRFPLSKPDSLKNITWLNIRNLDRFYGKSNILRVCQNINIMNPLFGRCC
ncbi:hypothetical protein M3Y97_00649600 [Aphelenchoides bicaudatus]|nr:hypothetical protein M3Y97_00649600 [Aphelenchoides bicaudatus]